MEIKSLLKSIGVGVATLVQGLLNTWIFFNKKTIFFARASIFLI